MNSAERLGTMAWLTAGLLAGILLGLLVGWVLWPTQFTDADLTVLQESYRRDYTVMIAANYAADSDLMGARRRLFQLGESDPEAWLLAVTVETILQGANAADAQHLVRLCQDLGLYSPLMEPYLTSE
jgi:hypothetical protein